jgi:hypothetical protein
MSRITRLFNSLFGTNDTPSSLSLFYAKANDSGVGGVVGQKVKIDI